MPASAGPAPPRRPSSIGASTRTPRLCTSAISGPSPAKGGLLPLVSIQRLEVLVEDAVLELLADWLARDLVVLAPEVAPRLVGGEQHAVVADAAALDLREEPADPEPDRPGDVGVDLVAL